MSDFYQLSIPIPFLVTGYDPFEELRCGNTWCPPSGYETPSGLNIFIYILTAVTALVRIVVMSDVIDVMFVEECLVDCPGGVWDDLINPTTVSNGLATFSMAHHRPRLVFAAKLIRADTHQEVDRFKGEFSLTELCGVPKVEDVIHAISVDTNRTIQWWKVWSIRPRRLKTPIDCGLNIVTNVIRS